VKDGATPLDEPASEIALTAADASNSRQSMTVHLGASMFYLKNLFTDYFNQGAMLSPRQISSTGCRRRTTAVRRPWTRTSAASARVL
jgi:hypothetical protein